MRGESTARSSAAKSCDRNALRSSDRSIRAGSGVGAGQRGEAIAEPRRQLAGVSPSARSAHHAAGDGEQVLDAMVHLPDQQLSAAPPRACAR